MEKIMKKYLLILLIFLTGMNLRSEQEIDSLVNSVKYASDREKIKIYNLLSDKVRRYSVSKSINYAYTALELGKKYNDITGEAEAEFNYGKSHYILMNYDDAIESFIISKALFMKINDNKGINRNDLAIAAVHNSLGDYYKALELCNNVLKSNKSNELRAQAFIDISEIFIIQSKLKNASENLDSARLIISKRGYTRLSGILFKTTGNFFKKSGNLDKAIEYYIKSIKICHNSNDSFLIINPLLDMAECYSLKKDLPFAIKLVSDALTYSRNYSYNEGIINSYKMLSQIYLNNNMNSKSLEFLKIYTNYRDSVFKESFLKSIDQSIHIESRIEILKTSNEFKTKESTFLIIVSVLVIVIALGLLSRYLYIRKKNKQLSDYNQKLKISEENLIVSNRKSEKYLSIIQFELKRATKYVMAMMPTPVTDGSIRTSWKFIPSLQLGGDAFGYHWIDKDSFAIYLLDVSGHGIGSALHSVSILNIIKNLALPDTDFKKPDEVIKALYKAFIMKNYNELFFTIWYGVYSVSQRELSYSSAGQHPALLFCNDTEPIELFTSNPLIGIFEYENILTDKQKISPDSVLLIFSDGAFEIKIDKKKYMSFNDFKEYLINNYSDKPDDIEDIYNYVKELNRNDNLDDDFSFLKVKFL
jgi:serine phosphatase RsbU (regulator of sigma subunit)